MSQKTAEEPRRPSRRAPVVALAALACAGLAAAPARAETVVLPEGSIASVPLPQFSSIPPWQDWNWADWPIKLNVTDTVAYNDNVYGLPNGVKTIPGVASRGDFSNLTVVGATTKIYTGQQVFFGSATYGVTRYLRDTDANSNQYSLSAGMNFALASRCTGTLAASLSKQPSLFDESVGVGINYVQNTNVSESARCLVWGGLSLIQNAAHSKTENSPGLNALNNSTTSSIAGGVRYDLTALDNFQLLYGHTDSLYTARPSALNVLGLANEVFEDDITGTYQRIFSEKVNITAALGMTRANLVLPGQPAPTVTSPHYNLTAVWQPTPKLQFTGVIYRAVGAPTSIIANLQVTDGATVSGAYALTPKLAATGSFGIAKTSGGQSAATPALAALSAPQNATSAALGLNYRATPFVTANAAYQYSKRESFGLATVENLFAVTVRYAPE